MGNRVPFTVVGGYLGAGKTTLVNQVLRQGAGGRRLAVLVNDFGDVDIDVALITAHDGATISLANGCVCCSLAEGFAVAMQQVRSLAVDHVLVECSGVANPRQVAQWGRTPGFTLDATVVVSDAETAIERAGHALVGDTVLNQIKAADLVVLSKADLVSRSRCGEVVRWLGSLTSAPVLVADRGQIAAELLLGTLTTIGSSLVGSVLDAHGEHVTVSVRPDAFDGSRAALVERLSIMPEGVLRVKGFVRSGDSPSELWLVQGVGCRVEVTVAVGSDAAPGVVAIAQPGTSAADLQDWLTASLR